MLNYVPARQLQKSAAFRHLKMMKSLRIQSSGVSCVLYTMSSHSVRNVQNQKGHSYGLCMLMACQYYFPLACPTLLCSAVLCSQ